MKKGNFLLVTLLLISIISVKAQTYSKGINVVSAGVGLGSSIAGYTYGSQSPAISFQYERGLFDAGPGVISLGGYLGFKTYKYTYDYSGAHYSSKWKYTIIGVRGTYHLTQLKVQNLDLYGGLMLSYNNLSFSDNSGNSTASYGSASGFSAFVGGRYYFAKNIGVFTELGYGVAYVNLGLATKF
jgi:hypothetical protein